MFIHFVIYIICVFLFFIIVILFLFIYLFIHIFTQFFLYIFLDFPENHDITMVISMVYIMLCYGRL